jgi:hypothetical protein
MRNRYKILFGKSEETKRSRGRPSRKWEDNTGNDLREIRWEDVNWMHLAEDRDE